MRSLLRKKRNTKKRKYNTKKYYNKQRGGNFSVEQINDLRAVLTSLQFVNGTTLTTEDVDDIITKIQSISQPFSSDFDQILYQLSGQFQNKPELMDLVDSLAVQFEFDANTDNEMDNSDVEDNFNGGKTKKYKKRKTRKNKRQSRKRN